MSSEVSLVSIEDELDAAFAAYVAANQSPGLAYGVVSADGLARSGGFGVANPAGAVPTADTPFPIASMSKSFCAAATLIARDRGLLSLDDPITRYFPEFKATGAPDGDVPPPTLRMLLSMSGGLTEDNSWVDPQIGTSEAELLAIVSRGLKYSHTPGTVYEYSNTGFTLVGMALQKATGRSYAEFVATELLAPLGMTATRLSPSEFDDAERAAGYSLDLEGTWVPYPVAESGAFLAAGGIVSTVRDLSTWVTWLGEAFRPGRASAGQADGTNPLSRASRREMQRIESVTPPSVALRPAGTWRLAAGGYGLGLFVDQELYHGTVVSHGGGLPGYKLFMCWHPDSGDGLVVLTNSHRGDPGTMAREGVLRLLSAHKRPATTVVLWPETVRARLDVESLIRSWDDDLAARVFAANVDFDRPLGQRRAEIERLVGEIGPLRAQRPVTEVVSAATSADVTWSVPGENGELIVMVHLTPAEPPQVQELEVRAIGLGTPRSGAPTDISQRRASLGQASLTSAPNVIVVVPPLGLPRPEPMVHRSPEDRRLRTPNERYAARLNGRGSSLALQEKILARERQNLDEALTRVAQDGSAVRMAAAIVAARRRFVAGSGKSLAYATLLAVDLSAGLSLVTLIDNAVVRAVDVLSEVRSTDVLVVFSMRRYRRGTTHLCREFRAAGGTVLVIADDSDAPTVPFADAVLIVSTESASYADSPTAVAAICHLVTTLATASAKGARRRLADRDRLARALDLYEED